MPVVTRDQHGSSGSLPPAQHSPTQQLVVLGEPVRARPSDPPVHQLRAALDTRLRALLAHDPGTRAGEDPEELHQMRVAVRRMRATLRAGRPLVERRWADELRAELGWLGRALGPVRDADVLIERLRGQATAFDETSRQGAQTLLEGLETERQNARTSMLAVLDSQRYRALLHRLAEAVSQPLPACPDGVPGTALIDLVRAEYRKLAKAVRAAGAEPPDEVLHALRIRGKRLRYTGELAAGAGRKPVRKRVGKLVKATMRMQDVLGEHQDACVAQQQVRRLLTGMGSSVDPNVAFAGGRLVEREQLCRAQARQAWPAAWRRVRRRARTLTSRS